MHHPLIHPRSPCAPLALVLAMALGSAASPGLAAPTFDPPPIADAPTLEHHVGKVIWTELVTPDVAAAERFYGALFGWTFEDFERGSTRYALARLDGVRVAGIVQHAIRQGAKREPSWLEFIAVQDVDVAVRNAVNAGGRTLRPPHSYAARGRQAILADPQGAVFGIMASFSGDPVDALAPQGSWIWSSLLARDASVDAAFYQTLFGYDVFDLAGEDGQEHVILSTDSYARAGVNTLPADAARRHPRWLGFVRVADAQAAAARAVELGGGVLVAPRVDRHGGLLAVLKDPAGAAFGVMEWRSQDGEELP
jgi:predicted enzyme related to lactoylglutathione lyase